MKPKVLFVVEGERGEKKVLGNTRWGLLSLIDFEYEITVVRGSIYELYENYKNGNYTDLVAYLRTTGMLSLPSSVRSREAFAAVYLIFDFDPHYQKYSDGIIREIVATFDNETDLGKVYLNYPMVEAFYHIESKTDFLNFYRKTVSAANLSGKAYKKLVKTETCFNRYFIPVDELCLAVFLNYRKAKQITKNNDFAPDIYRKILEYQIQLKNQSNEISVLATLPLLLVDYNKTMVAEKIYSTIERQLD